MSGFKAQLGFDATSADTLAASDLVGSIIRASGASVTSTLVSGKQALDVNMVNSISVDVDHASGDSVKIGDGTDLMAVNADGSINAVVTATDLDIRDLVAASDSVSSWLKDGSGNSITSSASALDVNIQSSDIALNVSDIANGTIENTAKTVTTTSAALLTSQLANRKDLWLQNRGAVNAFIGKPGVTTANGFEVQKGVSLQFKLGSAVSVHAVTAASTADFRLMEFAA
jgi:hypothetical protein